jgi:RND family efflux transporter MFP subunit
MEIQPAQLPLITEVVGRLAPNREVTLAAEVGGIVNSYTADVGDRVQKGNVVVSVNPRDYQLALKEAEANFAVAQTRLDLAVKAYDRAKSLLPREVITQDTFDNAEAEYLSAQASVKRVKVLVDISRFQLSKTRIRSPFNGQVAARMIETGQLIGAGQALMKIIDPNPMRVNIWLPENEYVHLDKSDSVSIFLDAYPDEVFAGKIDRIDIIADEKTNTFCVEILVNNHNLTLKTGMTAKVRIITSTIPNAILIPQSTVLYRSDREEVFIAGADNRAVLRKVKLGLSLDERIEVRDGLAAGDQLIVTGGQYLKPGDTILISAFNQTQVK